MWSRLTIVFEKPPYFIIHLVPCPFASFKLFTGILVALALRNAFFCSKDNRLTQILICLYALLVIA